MIPILIVAGPTASGKSRLALALAQRLQGEIVSADSRQVYARLDIGTAKPDREELERVRHHLIGIIEPEERYNAGRFSREAAAGIEKLALDGKTPLVCGGTGFYLQALVKPLFEEPAVPEEAKTRIRIQLSRRFESEGGETLHRELAAVDPDTAARLHPNDFQRVGRALELYYLTGRTLSGHFRLAKAAAAYRAFTVLLDPPDKSLKENIRLRARRMLEQGWAGEVEALLAAGVDPRAPGLQSLGYREIISQVRGEISREAAFEAIVGRTWQYARRQRTWFRNRPAELRLDPAEADPDRIVSLWRSQLEKFDGKGGRWPGALKN